MISNKAISTFQHFCSPSISSQVINSFNLLQVIRANPEVFSAEHDVTFADFEDWEVFDVPFEVRFVKQNVLHTAVKLRNLLFVPIF